jgi:hypothetical protein
MTCSERSRPPLFILLGWSSTSMCPGVVQLLL